MRQALGALARLFWQNASADRAALFDSAQNHEACAAELAFVVLLLAEILFLCPSISALDCLKIGLSCPLRTSRTRKMRLKIDTCSKLFAAFSLYWEREFRSQPKSRLRDFRALRWGRRLGEVLPPALTKL
jgi:hypothetical protein